MHVSDNRRANVQFRKFGKFLGGTLSSGSCGAEKKGRNAALRMFGDRRPVKGGWGVREPSAIQRAGPAFVPCIREGASAPALISVRLRRGAGTRGSPPNLAQRLTGNGHHR